MKDESEIIRLTRPVGGSDHVLGPQSGPATLIEYGDYRVPPTAGSCTLSSRRS